MECTHFTQGEIEEWYKGFMKSCPNGLVSSADFQDMYSDFFEGDASEFASHVFRTFDSDKSGFIDFKEFMYSLSITSRGNLEEKLEWAFKIYDVDGDGYVTKREMEDIIRSVYKMYADSRLGRKETPEQRTARIFEKFDLNKDGKLTIEEFKTGARSDPFLVLMMQYKSLHGRKESDPSMSLEQTYSWWSADDWRFFFLIYFFYLFNEMETLTNMLVDLHQFCLPRIINYYELLDIYDNSLRNKRRSLGRVS